MAYDSLVTRANAASLIPEETTREIFKAVTEQSAVLRLARRLRNMKRGELQLPVLSSLITANFVTGDTGLKQTSSVAWADKVITAEELAVIVPIPENVLDDSDYDLWGEIRPEVDAAFAAAIDAAILHGTNAPTSWPDDLQAAALAASNTASLAAFTDAYDAIMGPGGTLSMVEADGYSVNGHVAATTLKATLRGLRDANGQPIYMASLQGPTQYALDGSPILFPMNGALDAASVLLFSGDWNQLVYSIRQDMTFKIFTEGVITDGAGNVVYNLMQQDMVALRAVMRLGWQVPNPINRMNQTEASRYPFSTLTP
jgi:HK97 family phage major capsid protein